MSDNKNTKQLDILKLAPWVALVVLVIVMFTLWPRAQKGPVKSEKSQAETTASAESSTPVNNQAKSNKAEVISQILNFRSKPTIKEKNVIAAITKGTKVKVLEDQGKWLKVQLEDGRIGFITANKKYIKLINE